MLYIQFSCSLFGVLSYQLLERTFQKVFSGKARGWELSLRALLLRLWTSASRPV